MNLLRRLFSKVVFTCSHRGARQRIPLRRLHVFERFHHLEHGEPILIACPHCPGGLQMPSAYRTHTGIEVHVDPRHPPDNAFIHDLY